MKIRRNLHLKNKHDTPETKPGNIAVPHRLNICGNTSRLIAKHNSKTEHWPVDKSRNVLRSAEDRPGV
jgi:hypothetical protein